MARYAQTSPYATTPVVSGFLEILELRSFRKLPDDVVYQIDQVYEYRPDLLAYDLYGDSGLWWVFRVRNPNVLDDPIFDFRAGVPIYIPKKTTLVEDLGI